MAKVKVGLVGAGGGIANQRAQHFADSPDSELVVCASRTVEKATALAEESGCRSVETWQEVVSDPEVNMVAIATPNALHYEQARAALENGKHTSVEYPLCQSLAEADELYDLADKKGVLLHHGLNVRQEPLYRLTKDALPRLGEIAHARITYFGAGKWYVIPEKVGDMFLALHIHFVDYFRGFFGEVKSVAATRHQAGAGHDFCHSGTILMAHENNPASYIEFGMGYPERPPYVMSILGTRGYLWYDGELHVREHGKGEAQGVSLPKKQALREDSDSFIAEIVSGAPPLRTREDSRRTMEVALDCTRSVSTGEKITY